MGNIRGAALMTLAMLGFAVEDMCIKLMTGALPTWQIVLFIAIGGAAIFGALTVSQGQRLFTRGMLHAPILLRNLGEIIGTLGFVTALALSPLSTASAILQSAPLIVTLGAALFLGEPVGWRRWAAILMGFVGVILIIGPGTESFEPMSLFAVIGVLGLAIRDIATRRVQAVITSLQLSFLAFLMLVPTSAILAVTVGSPYVAPSPGNWGLLAVSVILGTVSYYAIVAAMRVGDVAFVTPFRYSRMLFALAVGFVVFGERPDALMLLGAGIIVASGLFTFWRERVRQDAA